MYDEDVIRPGLPQGHPVQQQQSSQLETDDTL